MHTDASHRYERGVDSQLQEAALQRATQLLIDIVGGKPGPIIATVSESDLPANTTVTLRQGRLQNALGVEIDAATVDEALARLDFAVAARTASDAGVEWQVVPPSHRFDIALEADLVEEVFESTATTIFRAQYLRLGRPWPLCLWRSILKCS